MISHSSPLWGLSSEPVVPRFSMRTMAEPSFWGEASSKRQYASSVMWMLSVAFAGTPHLAMPTSP